MCIFWVYKWCCVLDDFKPASVDSTKASELTVGSNNEVTVKVPHVQVIHVSRIQSIYFEI